MYGTETQTESKTQREKQRDVVYNRWPVTFVMHETDKNSHILTDRLGLYSDLTIRLNKNNLLCQHRIINK